MRQRTYRKGFNAARRYSLALTLAACAAVLTTAQPASASLFSMSEQDEIKAGQQAAAQAEQQFGGVLPPNDPRSIRVRAIGMQFAALSSRKNIPYSYKVLNNDKVLNAFACPGGPIYITKLLVDKASNDAEVAYVLGHETTHVDHKHIVQTVEKQQKIGLAAGILGALIGRNGGSSANVVNAVTNVAFNVWNSGYSREHENDADNGGVHWMAQLGYDPRAAITMLQKLGDGPDGPLQKVLADHPAPKDREQRVASQIQRENLLQVAAQHGGPRLTSNVNYGAGYASYNPQNTNGGYYPATQGGVPDYSQPRSGQSQQNQEIPLGAPIQLAPTGDAQVIMAPVDGIARWSGAQLQNNGNSVVLRRGGNTLELRRNSGVGYQNGQALNLSAPAQVYGGMLYAPIGTLVESLGGTATLDANNNLVWLTLGNNRGFVRLP